MWRISAIARAAPKSSSKAGMRRCFRDMRAASFEIGSEPPRPQNISAFSNHKRFSSRQFHATAMTTSTKWDDDDDDIDPNDPDDIPDVWDDYHEIDNNAEEEEREQYRLQQEKVNDELDSRKGRPWKDPWEIKEEQWMASDTSSESLADWNPSFVSRISLERLQVLPIEDGKGIPTLQEIVELSLPGSDPELHPARKTKTYAAYRKSQHYASVKNCVEQLAKDRVQALLKEASNNASSNSSDHRLHQDTIDALFEDLQEEAKADPSMDILSKHPSFASWVDRGLEEYLQTAQKEALAAPIEEIEEKESEESKETSEETDAATAFREGTPVFLDCYDPSEADGNGEGPMVPKILTPLGPHRHGGPGRMVEEWELSAHASTKRIMLRESTQQVAKLLTDENSASKIYVHGSQGVGKSALLASIVASARKSGSIVLYLPDGDRLRKNGFFITPSTHPNRSGMFDLQDLSKEALQQLVDSHDAAQQMEGMVADRKTLEMYFKDTQFKKLDEFMQGKAKEDGSLALLDLIEYSQENKKHAPMCYSVVVNRLMNQTEKKFMIVMDEFNCLYDKGHYFHMAYDEDVREAIPYHKISLFEPIMDAMGLSTRTVEEEEDSEETASSTFDASNTAVLVGTSESHAVSRTITTKLTECAQRTDSVSTVEVPRFSSLEADHVLANFEATGVGKLRLDRGDTLMNPQEMEYLKMASGSIGQKLLDVSIF